MARKKTEWTPAEQAKFSAMVRRGLPAVEIAAELTRLGVRGASHSTVTRRMRELKGSRPRALEAEAVPVAGVPDDPAAVEAAPVAMIDVWLTRVDQAYRAAEDDGNLAVQASLAARATALLEARRKASPPPAVDPNELPDLVAAAEATKKRMRAWLARRGAR